MVDGVIRDIHGRLTLLEHWRIGVDAAKVAEVRLAEERHDMNVKAIARVENISSDNHGLLTELMRRTERQAGEDDATAKDEAKTQERQAKYGRFFGWLIGILATLAGGDVLGHIFKKW